MVALVVLVQRREINISRREKEKGRQRCGSRSCRFGLQIDCGYSIVLHFTTRPNAFRKSALEKSLVVLAYL